MKYGIKNNISIPGDITTKADLDLLRGHITREEEIKYQKDFVRTQMEMFEKDKEKGIINLHGLESLFVDIRILLKLISE